MIYPIISKRGFGFRKDKYYVMVGWRAWMHHPKIAFNSTLYALREKRQK